MTNERRSFNIQSFQKLICGEIEKNNLRFGEKEERILLFTTKQGEKVYIQFPGKETLEFLTDGSGRVKHPFDFRPVIKKSDGTKLKDFTFKELWIVEELFNEKHKEFNTPLSCLYFRQGRMTIHTKVSDDYQFEIIENGEITSKGLVPFEWYSLDFDERIIDTFTYNGSEIKLDDTTTISLEGFIYFFELLLNNEDDKYNYRKGDLSSGRIKTSDSMLLLSSTLNGKMRLSELLQRFITGFGISSCSTKEISPSTGGLVEIISPLDELCSFLDREEVKYSKNGSIGNHPCLIKIPFIKTLVPKYKDDSEFFRKEGWNVCCIQKDGLFSENDLKTIKTLIKKRKENPNGVFFFFFNDVEDTQE